jgi:hypothetical protein
MTDEGIPMKEKNTKGIVLELDLSQKAVLCGLHPRARQVAYQRNQAGV